jgi:N-acetylglucosamine-6-phosphate deacetylase
MSTLVHSVNLLGSSSVDPAAGHADGWALFDGGRVVALGTGSDHPNARAIVDGAGGCLVPGFIDIHGHGGGGAGYDDGPDAIRIARALHRAHGTTRAVISLVTASIDDLAARASMVADLAETDRTILGSHLEGPFLDPGHKGAHTEALLRAPDAASVDRLVEAGRGTIRQVTLAPELPGAEDAIRRFAAAGVVVSVGHTDADAATTRRGFDDGATMLTHAFNAMPGIHHRAPGPVVAALRDERVTLEVIADGVHVDLDLVAAVFAAAGDRIALVTDAMAAAGAHDGRYELGGLAVLVADGVARLEAGGAIAGSTLTQDAALRNVVEAGVPLATAVAAATSTPARALGRPDLGRLDIGFLADAVLLDPQLRVRSVWVEGVPV